MSGLIATVMAAQGYWVAHCPAPYCYGAEHYGARRGGMGVELGGLFDDLFSCKECRGNFPAAWPVDRVEIERLLMDRPDPFTRNWLPGESIYDLTSQNIAHGVYPPASLEAMHRHPLDVGPSGPPTVHDEMTSSELTGLLFPGRSVVALEGGH